MPHLWLGNRNFSILALAMVAMFFVFACGTAATATPPPTAARAPAAVAAPTATKAPAAAAAPTATKAPAAVAAPTATKAPAPPTAIPTATPVAAAKPAPVVAARHKPAGELRVAMATFGNERWGPGNTAGAEHTVTHIPFENFLTRDPVTGNWVGELAESWDVREGGKVWEFRLRKGVQFHNKNGEMTADDVKFTFERLTAEGSTNARVNVLRKIETLQIVDPSTVILNFKTPEILFGDDVNSALLGTQYIFPKKYITAVGEEKADREPIGTGPYKVVKHVRGDRIEFEAVEDQWSLTPAFAKLTALKVPEDSTRVAMVRAGSVEIIEIGVDFAAELKAAKVKTVTVPQFASVGVTLGGQWPTKPTYDATVPWALPDQEKAKKVRLALNLALDRQAIIDAALGGLGTPSVAVGFYFQGKPWTPEDLKPFPYDPAQARTLMAEAGYPNCFEFTMNLTAWPGRAFLPVVGEAVATQWEANLGCKIKRRPLDRAVFTKDFNQRTYAGVALAYAMPFVGQEPWQLWRLIGSTKGAAMLIYEDPQLDAFLDKVGSTADFNERVKIMRDMARYIYDQAPRVEIAETFGLFAVSDKVKSWPLTPSNGSMHNLDYVNLVWAPPGQPVVLAK